MTITNPKLFGLFLSILLFAHNVFAQSLQGKVVMATTQQPVISASVFLSNTSIGTVTNDKGEFTIAHFPAGRFDVVVSSIGYETQIITITSTQIPVLLTVQLQQQAKQLAEVVLEPYDKDGWQKWGRFFMDNFIGKSAFASDCKLLNSDAVKLKFNKKQNTLKAFADEALVIENKALGYILKYQLKTFEFQFSAQLFYYQGYPLFQEMQTTKPRIQKRWIANREEAYYGSLMHFMRSVYRNKLVQQGFEVRKLIKVDNKEKARVKAIYRSQTKGGVLNMGDSANYYQEVMRQTDQIATLINIILPGDSIANALDVTTAGLEFSDYLQVTYTKKKEPFEYYNGLGKKYGEKSVVSELHLPNKIGVAVLANGSYFEGVNLITSQFWAWWEKMATLLPLDYWPGKSKNP